MPAPLPALLPRPSPATPDPTTPALLASLKRCAFLLNSARLVISDPQARDTAREAVNEALAAIAAAERAAR